MYLTLPDKHTDTSVGHVQVPLSRRLRPLIAILHKQIVVAKIITVTYQKSFKGLPHAINLYFAPKPFFKKKVFAFCRTSTEKLTIIISTKT